MSEEINLLLSRLKELRVEEDKIISEIDRLSHLSSADTTVDELRVVSPAPPSPKSPSNQSSKIVKGDRVRIMNYINTPSGRMITEKDWLGTVTSVAVLIDRVYFVTDGGTKTHRAAKNLQN